MNNCNSILHKYLQCDVQKITLEIYIARYVSQPREYKLQKTLSNISEINLKAA